MPNPTLLALDFDGVICDGLLEYFQTAWKAYGRLWQDAPLQPPADLADRFYRLRPVVETGWEMPVLLHALLTGWSDEDLLQTWPTVAQQLLVDQGLDKKMVATIVDHVRDEWIQTDLSSWLALHRFYPGVVERLQQFNTDSVPFLIISTKEGRFIRQLLLQQGVTLTDNQILGKEMLRPKTQILRDIIATATDLPVIWFVEDRLKTLQAVQQQPDLSSVKLFLADWGYNTAIDQAIADQDPNLTLLSLTQFAQDFSAWN